MIFEWACLIFGVYYLIREIYKMYYSKKNYYFKSVWSKIGIFKSISLVLIIPLLYMNPS